MKSGKVDILYIGKAQNLRERLQSYLEISRKGNRIKNLISKTVSIEWIITANETDAFILENTLIKLHKPYYNIQLKDDKTYPYIKITTKTKFPRIFLTRQFIEDGSHYFGPFTNVRSARNLINIIKHIFKLRSCGEKIPGKACLNFHINLCSAPCINRIDFETYRESVDNAISFIQGNINSLLIKLSEEMQVYASSMLFEKAAVIRDIINSLNKIKNRQHIIMRRNTNADFITVMKRGEISLAGVFNIRNGVLLNKEIFQIKNPLHESEEIIMRHFLIKYVRMSPNHANIIKTDKVKSRIIYDKILNKLNNNIRLTSIYGEEEREIINLLKKNLIYEIEKRLLEKYSKKDNALSELGSILKLNKLPEFMACFDISHLKGDNAVGSAVVFKNGKPLKKRYRRFKIKYVKGINDSTMINEIVGRYFSHIENQQIDLVIVDGGAIQLRNAKDALKKLNLNITAISIAKRLEEIYIDEKKIISLPLTSSALKLIQRIRDESHRFAISYNRKLRRRELKFLLQQIDGIGKVKSIRIMSHFRTIKSLEESSIMDIEKIPGITHKLALSIKEFLLI
jgi:excinuclease ABC subunit C